MRDKLFRGYMSIILIVTLILGTVNINWAYESCGQILLTDGEIIAENYKDSLGLSDEEVNILKDYSLRGEVHTLTAPTSGDNLISVDLDKKTISVKEYKDEYGNRWKPEEAYIVYSDGSEELSLKNGKADFTYDGKNYSVEVLYNAYVEVGEQVKLINGPYYLVKGVENLDILEDDCSVYLMLMETILPQLEMLVDGSMIIKLEEGSAAYNAIVEFNRQLDKNGVLDLTDMLEGKDGFVNSESKVLYLLENGSQLKACTKETYEYAKAIVDEEYIQNIISFAENVESLKAKGKQLKRAMQQLNLLVEAMQPVYDDEWKILDENVLRTDEEYSSLIKSLKQLGLDASTSESIDYQSLDALVEAAEGKLERHIVTAYNPLKATSAKLVKHVNRKSVTVKLNANVIPEGEYDSEQTAPLEEYSVILNLEEGSDKEAVLAAAEASGIEASALDKWTYDISDEHYERSTSELPDELTEDTVYTITYNPKLYDLKFVYDDSQSKKVPYGYRHSLELSKNAGMSYDYTVNGEFFEQGEIYFVSGDTKILRSEGKEREGFKLAVLVAEDYSKKLSKKEKTILKSPALISDSLNVRVADNSDEKLIVINGQEISAKDYDAGTDYFKWVPVSADIKRSGATIESVDFENNTADFESTNYEYIEVEYQLIIKLGDDPVVRGLLNLPNKLVSEADEQKADMNELLTAEVYNNLGTINKTMMNAMAGNLGQESKDAIDIIKDKAFNGESGKLYLYEYLSEYKNSGLKYYYRDNNYAKIKDQVLVLAEQLSVVANDPELPSLLEDLGYGEYKNKIDKVVKKLEEMKSHFSAPNAAIDLESESLDELVAALEMEGEVSTYKEADGLKKSVTLKEAAANTVFVNVEICLEKGNGQLLAKETASIAYVSGSVIEDTDLLNKAIASMEKSLDIDKEHYTCVIDGEVPGIGYVMKDNLNIKYTWKPKNYSVKIEGTDTTLNFTYDNPVISMPLCTEANRVYVYSIAGREFEAEVSNNSFDFMKYFTTKEFDEIFEESDELTISRRIEDVGKRNVLELVDNLNTAILKAGYTDDEKRLIVSFIPYERNGELELVLRLPTEHMVNNLVGVLPIIAKELLSSRYSYAALNESEFISDGGMTLQSLVDAALKNDGFGTSTILNVIDEGGDIVELSLDGAAVIGANDNTISISKSEINDTDIPGGELMNVLIKLGTNSNSIDYTVPLHITIEDFDTQRDDLKEFRASTEEFTRYMSLSSQDGILEMDCALSDKEYARSLSRLFVSGKADIRSVSNISVKTLFDSERALAEEIFADDSVDYQVLKNTGKKYNLSLVNAIDDNHAKQMFGIFKHLSESLTFEPISENGKVYNYEARYSVQKLFERYNIPSSFKKLIKEADGYLSIPGHVSLANMDKSYEAFIVNMSASEADRYDMTADLESALNTEAELRVSLLENTSANLSFKNKAILDLNGHSLSGHISSEDGLEIINNSGASSFVDASLSGNIKISGGSYTQDVSSMLSEGYSQINGEVRSPYFTISRDNQDNYIVNIDADYLTKSDSVSQRYIVLEILRELVLKTSAFSEIKAGGKTIYKTNSILSENSIAAAYENVASSMKSSGLESIANKLLSDITNFSKLKQACLDDSELSSYVLVESPWSTDFSVNAEDSYIKTQIKASDDSDRHLLSVRIAGDETSKNRLANLSGRLLKVLSVNKADVSLGEITYSDGEINISSGMNADVDIDFSSDDNYAISLGIIAAYSMNNKTDMLTALNDALGTYKNTEKLVSELEALPFSKLIGYLNNTQDISLSDMAASLGISAKALSANEVAYHDVLNLTLGFTNRMGIKAEDKSLSKYKLEEGFAEYELNGMDFDSMKLSLGINLCKEPKTVIPTATPTINPTASTTPAPGYTAEPTATPDVMQTPQPTASPIPTGTGKVSAEVKEDASLYGSQVQGTVIVLDAVSDGIDADYLLSELLSFDVIDEADGYILESETRFISGVNNGKVENGAEIEVIEICKNGRLLYEWFTVIMKGDVNQDGEVNNTDVILFSDYWLGYNDTSLSDIQLQAADMDSNGRRNNTDAVLILDKIFKYPYRSSLLEH